MEYSSSAHPLEWITDSFFNDAKANGSKRVREEKKEDAKNERKKGESEKRAVAAPTHWHTN